jgi:peptidoglycan/LPS O-acetylase OafA/YrhL
MDRMAGLASLLGALLIALSLQRRLWDDPEPDEPLAVQVGLLGLLCALAAAIVVVASAAIEGDTELTRWETVVTSMALGGGLLFLIVRPLVDRTHLLGATLEQSIPKRLQAPARWLWSSVPVLLALTVVIVAVVTGR